MTKGKMINLLLIVACAVFISFFPAAALALDESGWTYEVDNGKAVITSYSGPAGDVTIPGQLGGHDVTAIGSDVFTSVAVTSLSIPEGVLNIDGSAFWECKTLEAIDVDAQNPNYMSVDGIVFSKNGTELVHYPAAKEGASYTVPDSVVTIGRCAFDHNQNLQSISLPDTVTQIGGSAFWRCQSLAKFTVPKSVTSIGEAAFANCTGLTELAVDNMNPSFKSSDGVLFDITGTSLIQYPAGRPGSYIVPDGVTAICPGSFRGSAQLTDVSISDSVTDIGNAAFAYCESLEQVSLGSGVGTIGGIAFQACPKLADVRLPASMTGIEGMAFDSCEKLKGVYFMGAPPVIADNAFQGTAADFSVYCHYSVEPAWSDFAVYPIKPFCVVALDSQGGSAVPEQAVVAGGYVESPASPVYAGYEFSGWYTDAACTNAWDFNTAAASEDMTLYAKWSAVLELSSSDADARINDGESITLTPSIGGGEWNCDNEYLARSENTFTAIIPGTTTVSYSVDGRKVEYSITIGEKMPVPTAAESSSPASAAQEPSKQGFPWVAVIAAGAAVLILAVVLAGLKMRKRKNNRSSI